MNWGTFDGHHVIDVARRGHLFTGPSGSGKSSLLDAIATVLTPSRHLRFNAAAQETTARADDRTVVTYVRGAWSKEADAELDRAVSTYLRRGATWSGVLLRYADGRGGAVSLARLFHLRGVSTDKADLQDAAVVVHEPVELLDLQGFAARGIDARGLQRRWPDAQVTSGGAHKAYFARLERLLGLSGDNALQLLHRMQSAKNLGSLDTLFRGFMLDEPRTFGRAKNATEQFGELREAHRLVLEARDQVAALAALEPAIARFEAAAETQRTAERLQACIDPYQDRLQLRLAREERGRIDAERAVATAAAENVDDALRTAEEEVRRADAAVAAAGGDRLQVEQLLEQRAHERVTAAERERGRLAEALSGVGVAVPADRREFLELQRTVGTATSDLPQVDHRLQDEHSRLRREVDLLDRELAESRRSRSNLPQDRTRARRMIAEHLGVAESALPFAGELLDVRPAFADWTGAIERVLRPLALTLLVRHEQLPAVRRFVDRTPLDTRLVFEDVLTPTHAPRPTRSPRSLVHRVETVEGPFRAWLEARLASDFDVECVDGPEEFDASDRAVTISGLVKSGRGRYEKDDRSRVGDRRSWYLGSDGTAKSEAVAAALEQAQGALRSATARLDAAQAQVDAARTRAAVLVTALRQDWGAVDVAAAQAELERREAALAALTAGDGDLTAALHTAKDAGLAVTAARRRQQDAGFQVRDLARRTDELTAAIATFAQRTERTALDEADEAALAEQYRDVGGRHIERAEVGDVGRRVAARLHGRAMSAADEREKAAAAFQKGALAFGSRWPVPVADLSATVEDRLAYRDLRQRIEARGLPEHEQRFQALLRDKSRELIGHLRSDLLEATRLVRERIEPVNASLGRSRFEHDRHLRIKVREQRGPEVRQFLDDLKAVVDGGWEQEDLAAAELRFAVLASVMERLSSSEPADAAWRRRVLDTREHVTFQALEIAPDGNVANVHDSSAGLSGGQRQKLVIFCLAAALRYQLAPDEQELPVYATVVLDEAFDKADSSFTRMAMDVFVKFGFHMILATPQKLLQTIEPYVGGISSIANPSRKLSVVATVRWDAEPGG